MKNDAEETKRERLLTSIGAYFGTSTYSKVRGQVGPEKLIGLGFT